MKRESTIQFDNHTSPESIFHMEEPTSLAEYLHKAFDRRNQLTTEPPDTYQVVKKSKDGLKLTLCKGKDPPGQMRVKNITKDGLKLKIFRISTPTPFGTQSD